MAGSGFKVISAHRTLFFSAHSLNPFAASAGKTVPPRRIKMRASAGFWFVVRFLTVCYYSIQ